jgi:hypothetical protein
METKEIKIKALPVQVAKYWRKVDERMPLNPVVAFIGSTASGKTTCMLNLLLKKQYLKDYYHIFIFSKNYKRDSIWKNVDLEPKYISLEYNEVKIQSILDTQMRKKEKHKEKHGSLDTFKCALIIFDDMISNLRSKYLGLLTTMNRHYRTHIWILSQQFKSISPIIRNQIINWIIFPSNNEGESKRMSEELGSKKFIKFLEHVNKEDYGFLHIDKKSKLKFRYRKGFDTYLELKGNEVIEHDLKIVWSDKNLKTKKCRKVKLNKKKPKKKKNKTKEFNPKMYFEDFLSSESESSSESSYYDE